MGDGRIQTDLDEGEHDGTRWWETSTVQQGCCTTYLTITKYPVGVPGTVAFSFL